MACPEICRGEENSDCAASKTRTAGLSSNHGVPQAAARRGTREPKINFSRKQNHAFVSFQFYKRSLRVRKLRLSVSAPHLPHTCGSRRKGEAAAFLSQTLLKKGKITLFPFFHCEYTDGGEVSRRSMTGVPLNAARRGEKPPPVWRANLRANARQVSPFLTEISFVSSKEIS